MLEVKIKRVKNGFIVEGNGLAQDRLVFTNLPDLLNYVNEVFTNDEKREDAEECEKKFPHLTFINF